MDTLDRLFSKLTLVKIETKYVSVEVDNCTLYIPTNNLSAAIIPEFRKQFEIVYNKTKKNNASKA